MTFSLSLPHSLVGLLALYSSLSCLFQWHSSISLSTTAVLLLSCSCSCLYTSSLTLTFILLHLLFCSSHSFKLMMVFPIRTLLYSPPSSVSSFDTHSPVRSLVHSHFTNRTKVKAFISNRAVGHKVISFATKNPKQSATQTTRAAFWSSVGSRPPRRRWQILQCLVMMRRKEIRKKM